MLKFKLGLLDDNWKFEENYTDFCYLLFDLRMTMVIIGEYGLYDVKWLSHHMDLILKKK